MFAPCMLPRVNGVLAINSYLQLVTLVVGAPLWKQLWKSVGNWKVTDPGLWAWCTTF